MIKLLSHSLCSLIITVLFLVSNVAHAEVFKCISESTGKVTFTDTACPDKGTGDYVPVKPANVDSVYTSTGDGSQRQSQRTNSRSQTTSPSSAQQTAATGYECSGGGKTWVSRTPCPTTKKIAEHGIMSGVTASGTPINGSTVTWKDVPVKQKALKKKDYCKQSKQHNSDAIVERNKAGCSYWDYH